MVGKSSEGSSRNSATPLRIGLLGASRIAPTAILRPVKERDDIVVTAVAARDGDRAKLFAQEHGIAGVASSYDDLLSRPDVDLVYIGLPPSEHAQWSIAAVQAGKAVLCEKVFAMTSEQARLMVGEAARAERPLLEAILYRFHPILTRAFEIVATGKLGRVLSAKATASVRIPSFPGAIAWSPHLGGGALMELGCFPIHALRTILGSEPVVIDASSVYKNGVDATTEAVLEFPGGIRAEIGCSIDAEMPSIALIVEGDAGRLEIVNYVLPQQGYRFRVEAKTVTIDETAPVSSPYDFQIAHVVDVMAGRALPLTGGDDAIANMTAIDSIRVARAMRHAQNGTAPIQKDGPAIDIL